MSLPLDMDARNASPSRVGQKLRRALRVTAGAHSLLAGAVLLGIVILLAIGARWFSGYDPMDMVGTPFTWPLTDRAFPLGSDMMGRDIFSGIAYGARMSLAIGLCAGILAAVAGTLIGVTAGYFGGWIDDILMRVTELFQTMPSLLFSIVMVVVLRPSIQTIIASVALTSWPQVARLVRAEAMRIRQTDYVHAAVVIGMHPAAIVSTHVLPNAITPAVVMVSILAGNAILTEAALSFLGLGDPNVVTWGSMIGSGREALQTAWYMTAIPGVAVLITVLSLNLLGNGLNDLINPRRRAVL
jgi:peptide/nickel transport system permease protein